MPGCQKIGKTVDGIGGVQFLNGQPFDAGCEHFLAFRSIPGHFKPDVGIHANGIYRSRTCKLIVEFGEVQGYFFITVRTAVGFDVLLGL